MENIVLQVDTLKNDLIDYVINVAKTNKLSYLSKGYDKYKDIVLYKIQINNRLYVVNNIRQLLNTYSIEDLSKFTQQIYNDTKIVLPIHKQLKTKIIKLLQDNNIKVNNILSILMERDLKGVKIDNEFINQFAEIYINNICDKKDLECIISYCRM